MSSIAHAAMVQPEIDAGAAPPEIAPVPRIAIEAVCETPETAAVLEGASRDRRLARARVTVRAGSIAEAAERYAAVVTPDLLILESRAGPDSLLAQLDRLAEVCAATTRVVVIGHSNDISLFRALMARGVSDYLLAPIEELSVIAAISRLYRGAQARPLGKTIAFLGAKGGAGSSTMAHNVAWNIAHGLGSHVMLADLDLAFGTAALDFNLEPGAGIAEALRDLDGLDELKLDRLLARQGDNLSLLTAPAELAQCPDPEEGALERIIEIAKGSVPYLVLDLPHVWTSRARGILADADEVVITAEPDLASLRNAKAVIESLQQARRNDLPPKLILNRVGMPKRPEIDTAKFAKALKLEPIAAIAFSPHLFGTAANNGQMIGQTSARSRIATDLETLAQLVTGRKPAAVVRRRFLRPWRASKPSQTHGTGHASIQPGPTR